MDNGIRIVEVFDVKQHPYKPGENALQEYTKYLTSLLTSEGFHRFLKYATNYCIDNKKGNQNITYRTGNNRRNPLYSPAADQI